MRAENLKNKLEDFIVKKILKPSNCTMFYLESIKFQNAKIQKACEEIMVINFAEICKEQKGIEFLRDLPYEAFREICDSDSLYILDEKIVVELIIDYLKHRDTLPLLDEEDPMKNLSNLTKEERDKRAEEEKKRQEEEKKKEEEEKKAEETKFAALDELGKV